MIRRDVSRRGFSERILDRPRHNIAATVMHRYYVIRLPCRVRRSRHELGGLVKMTSTHG